MDVWGSRRVAFEVDSEGAMLRGLLYEAVKGEPPFPIVVMTHGTSATIPMVTDRYAEVFAEAGVSALSTTIGTWGSVAVSHVRRSTRGCSPVVTEMQSLLAQPSRVKIHEFVVTVGNYDGVAILETDDVSAIRQMTSTFAVFDFTVQPVLDVADAIGPEAAALEWRSSIA